MREISCEKLHNHHVVITHAQPEVNFSSNRIGHVSCIKARGLRLRADEYGHNWRHILIYLN